MKCLTSLLCGAMVSSLTCLALTGDLNVDGFVDAADLAMIKAISASRIPAVPQADLDQDGLIDEADVQYMRDCLQGLPVPQCKLRQTIGADGATLTSPELPGFKLVIPAGALASPSAITVGTYPNQDFLEKQHALIATGNTAYAITGLDACNSYKLQLPASNNPKGALAIGTQTMALDASKPNWHVTLCTDKTSGVSRKDGQWLVDVSGQRTGTRTRAEETKEKTKPNYRTFTCAEVLTAPVDCGGFVITANELPNPTSEEAFCLSRHLPRYIERAMQLFREELKMPQESLIPCPIYIPEVQGESAHYTAGKFYDTTQLWLKVGLLPHPVIDIQRGLLKRDSTELGVAFAHEYFHFLKQTYFKSKPEAVWLDEASSTCIEQDMADSFLKEAEFADRDTQTEPDNGITNIRAVVDGFKAQIATTDFDGADTHGYGWSVFFKWLTMPGNTHLTPEGHRNFWLTVYQAIRDGQATLPAIGTTLPVTHPSGFRDYLLFTCYPDFLYEVFSLSHPWRTRFMMENLYQRPISPTSRQQRNWHNNGFHVAIKDLHHLYGYAKYGRNFKISHGGAATMLFEFNDPSQIPENLTFKVRLYGPDRACRRERQLFAFIYSGPTSKTMRIGPTLVASSPRTLDLNQPKPQATKDNFVYAGYEQSYIGKQMEEQLGPEAGKPYINDKVLTLSGPLPNRVNCPPVGGKQPKGYLGIVIACPYMDEALFDSERESNRTIPVWFSFGAPLYLDDIQAHENHGHKNQPSKSVMKASCPQLQLMTSKIIDAGTAWARQPLVPLFRETKVTRKNIRLPHTDHSPYTDIQYTNVETTIPPFGDETLVFHIKGKVTVEDCGKVEVTAGDNTYTFNRKPLPDKPLQIELKWGDEEHQHKFFPVTPAELLAKDGYELSVSSLLMMGHAEDFMINLTAQYQEEGETYTLPVMLMQVAVKPDKKTERPVNR